MSDDAVSIPWRDEDAERSVLGAILAAYTLDLDGPDTAAQARAEITSRSAFSSPSLGAAWAAIIRLHDAQQPATIIAVRRALADMGETDAAKAVTDLAGWDSSSAHVRHHASIVAEMHRRRTLAYAGSAIHENLRAGMSAADAARAIEASVQTLNAAAVDASDWIAAADMASHVTDATRWRVQGLIPEACVVMLAGPPKVGKSYFLASVARAAASGGTVIGLETAETPSPVLWLTEESPSTLVEIIASARLRELPVHFLPRANARHKPWPQVMAEAAAFALKIGARLVIVDTLADWCGLKDENDAVEANAAMLPLKDAKARGIASLLTHHIVKNPDAKGAAAVRGSSALTGAVDGFILLRKEGGEDSTVRSLYGAGRGGGWVDGVRYEREADGALVRLGTRQQVAAAKSGKPILEAVQADPGVSRVGLYRAVGGNKTDFELALADLIGQGRLRQVEEGSAKRLFPA